MEEEPVTDKKRRSGKKAAAKAELIAEPPARPKEEIMRTGLTETEIANG